MAIDAESICRIIKACGKSQVTRLKIEGLEIEFSSDRTLEPPKAIQNELPWARQLETVAEVDIEKPAEVHLTEDDKQAFRDMEELQLSIDNPLAYEQWQIDDHLEAARERGIADAKGTEGRGP